MLHVCSSGGEMTNDEQNPQIHKRCECHECTQSRSSGLERPVWDLSKLQNWEGECGRGPSIDHPVNGYCIVCERIKAADTLAKSIRTYSYDNLTNGPIAKALRAYEKVRCSKQEYISPCFGSRKQGKHNLDCHNFKEDRLDNGTFTK